MKIQVTSDINFKDNEIIIFHPLLVMDDNGYKLETVLCFRNPFDKCSYYTQTRICFNDDELDIWVDLQNKCVSTANKDYYIHNNSQKIDFCLDFGFSFDTIFDMYQIFDEKYSNLCNSCENIIEEIVSHNLIIHQNNKHNEVYMTELIIDAFR